MIEDERALNQGPEKLECRWGLVGGLARLQLRFFLLRGVGKRREIATSCFSRDGIVLFEARSAKGEREREGKKNDIVHRAGAASRFSPSRPPLSLDAISTKKSVSVSVSVSKKKKNADRA